MIPVSPDSPASAAEPQPVRLTDPVAIRALAHPARLAVIEELFAGRELTATECADIAGLSPSAMSYHLRSLEKAGIVRRAESTGDGRERPWRAAGTHLIVESSASSLAHAASNALTSTILGRLAGELDAWTGRSAESGEWKDLGGIASGHFWLVPEEAREIERWFQQLIDRYRDRDTGERPAAARRMRVATLLFPVDRPAQAVGSQRDSDDDPA